jgi:hypothetical protein
MGIEASYRRINAAERDRLQQLPGSYPILPVRWQTKGLTP